ncbi:acetyl-CoA carboxylase biotin carboxyl carrier protein subunit [Catellatospora sp. KI3]|uniref:acetyl-CoA carboxylase biotin carboxyl carrier protein n=1 Tax=Catellatospora sp. KI3 TaxID=3041620 RepID=UPI0024823F50|nr:acetyl-CoA carboxylase biotin carboxyl carrier protein subunit [Catellatospora sp. KI3]MDI1463873.1 acetyl-CoA carboxylase biotin carboxyl carrier protein subunit [Catellatospora sp. KI3]
MTGLLDPSMPAMTCAGGELAGLPEVGRTIADDLDDVRRSAQRLLAEVGTPPSALRIRAGEVLVELEWATAAPAPPPASVLVPAPAPVAAPAQAAVTVTVEAPAAPPVATDLRDLCATTVGTFYRAAEPGTAPFVVEGDVVRRGQQVAIIEVMKLMIPVEAEADGRIVAIHAADGTSVEYGDRLFSLAAGHDR